MYFAAILASWVKFDVPVLAVVSVGAIVGWMCHAVVVGNSFVSLDPISSQWLRLPEGKHRARQRVAMLQQPAGSVSMRRRSAMMGTQEDIKADPLMALLYQALPPNHQLHETRIINMAGRFGAQDLGLSVLSQADGAQLSSILSSPALKLTLGEQLLIHKAVKEPASTAVGIPEKSSMLS